MEIREKQMQKYRDLVAQLKAKENGETIEIDKKGVTLTELKASIKLSSFQNLIVLAF